MQSDPLHDFAFGSFGGFSCAQFWVDFLLWEAVLNTNRQIETIIEIGTWQGGFSRYLHAQAQHRGMGFVTYDSIVPELPPTGFTHLDVFRYPEDVVDAADGPTALFCDGGNKPRELRTFPPLMPDGSIFFVHDWGTETLPSDVPDFLEEIYGDFCDQIGSITRVFKLGELPPVPTLALVEEVPA